MGDDTARHRPRLRTLLIDAVVLVAAVLFCGAVVAVGLSSRTPTYTATTLVTYTAGTSQDIIPSSDTGDITRTLATQAAVVTGDNVMSTAAATLGVKQTDLVDATVVTTSDQSNVLTISIDGPDAARAAAWANAVATAYIDTSRLTAQQSLRDQADALDAPIKAVRVEVALAQRQQRTGNAAALQQSLASLVQQQSQLQAAAQAEKGPVEQVATALVPASPSSTSAKTGAVLGAAAGFVLGLGILLAAAWWRQTTPVD